VEGAVNKQEACDAAKGEPDALGTHSAAKEEANTLGIDAAEEGEAWAHTLGIRAAVKDALREVSS
jgi:hypothetical protein